MQRLPALCQSGLIGTFAVLLGLLATACEVNMSTEAPITIGLIAPLSGGSAASGRAIQRGMLLAIDEVNRAGGVLGRALVVVVRDVANDPAAGVAALRELIRQHGIIAVFGGSFSPVMLAQLDEIHASQIILINPWGSATAITRNGRKPNYAFRISAIDEEVAEFLVRYAVDIVGSHHPGIIADTTAWGDSNVVSLTDWLARRGTAPAGVERFDQGDTNMNRHLSRLRRRGADSLLLVANAPEGAAVVRGLATLDWKPPVVSHWGISAGPFVELAGVDNAEGVLTFQTFSFFGPLSPKAKAVLQAYHARFKTRRVDEVLAPVGVAHGYDGIHLLVRAIRRARTIQGPQVRDALERMEPYDGLIKRYAPAFTPERHDALLAADYMMAVWHNGRLVPAPRPRLEQ